MSKSLGQINYEAMNEYCMRRIPSFTVQPWDTLSKVFRDEYEAGANAVKAAVLEWRPISEAIDNGKAVLGYDQTHGRYMAQHSKAYRRWYTIPGDYSRRPTHYMPLPPDPEPTK